MHVKAVAGCLNPYHPSRSDYTVVLDAGFWRSGSSQCFWKMPQKLWIQVFEQWFVQKFGLQV
jgi:hypothetical protein